MERTKKLFLSLKLDKEDFLNRNSKNKEKVIKKILWNASIKNKKIANFSFKEPYNILSKIENSSNNPRKKPNLMKASAMGDSVHRSPILPQGFRDTTPGLPPADGASPSAFHQCRS